MAALVSLDNPSHPVKTFKHTEKQIEALSLLTRYAHTMLMGGSRSGKTFLLVRCAFIRAFKVASTNHLFVRKHLSHARTSLWLNTIPQVLDKCFPGTRIYKNTKEMYIQLDNGSRIWVAGTDDKERIEKILGNEFSTIIAEEASQISYDAITTLDTRLAENKGLSPRFWYSCNPPTKSHWTFKVFVKKIDPDSKNPLTNPDEYAALLMNPIDNKANLSDDYFRKLDNLPIRKRQRFRDGLFLDEIEGALFEERWIVDNRSGATTLEQLKKTGVKIIKIAIGIDPAVTAKKNSDKTGIVVCAQGIVDKVFHYYVLCDASRIYKPLEWGLVVKNLAAEYDTDYVVCETNQGGDLVESNLRMAGYTGLIERVHTTVGKHVRAEPIAGLYQSNLVHHLLDSNLNDLEDVLINYIPLLTENSPDEMDALVHCISSFKHNMDNSQLMLETDYAKASRILSR